MQCHFSSRQLQIHCCPKAIFCVPNFVSHLSGKSSEDSGLGERLDERDQLLGAAQGDRVVVAGAYSTHTAVSLEPGQSLARGILQESLLSLVRVSALVALA